MNTHNLGRRQSDIASQQLHNLALSLKEKELQMNVYCEVCHSEMEIMRDLGTELHVHPCGCSGNQASRPTPLALDAAMPPSAEPDSGLESVPAVEFDTQPRG